MSTYFQNLRIGTRLALSFGAVIVLIVGMFVFNRGEMAKSQALAVELSGPQAERMALVKEWRQNLSVNVQVALAIGLSSDKALAQHFAANIENSKERTTEVVKRFAELEATPDGVAAQTKLAMARKEYVVMRDKMMSARASDDSVAATKIAGDLESLVANYLATMGELVALEERRNVALGHDVTAAMVSMETADLVVAIVCILISALLGWLLTASIVRPLSQAQQTADRIADGDLSVDLVATGTDEVGRLTSSLGKMQDALRSLVGGIRLSIDSITVASSEVAAGNHDLSARTEQSASSLQQTASSVEQIAVTVRQGADSAAQANQLATSAAAVAKKGGDAVLGIVRTMDGLQESSKKIADIIGTIDGIAFQTNILALNAAVEAARAGEQGRGFAVVASEVRSLAQRSAAAAKEIKTLIGDSVERVQSGSSQVRSAGETLTEVVTSVQRVSDIVGEISLAAKEQAKGIQEINQAVTNLDQATQGNAALVEQSAAAASSLKDQALVLAASVQRFRLNTTAMPAAPVVVRSALKSALSQ